MVQGYDPEGLQRQVVDEIVRRGYGVDWRPHVHLGLTRGTGVYRKFDDTERRESAGAITRDQWIAVVMANRSVADIATAVIEVCERSLGPPQPAPKKKPKRKRKPLEPDRAVAQADEKPSAADEKPPAPDIDPKVLELARVLSMARNPPKAKPTRGRPKGAKARKKKGA